MSSMARGIDRGSLQALSRELIDVDMIRYVADAAKALLRAWSEQASEPEAYYAALEECRLGGFCTLELFLFNLANSASISPVVFMSVLVFLRRLEHRREAIAVSARTAYALVLCSLILAFKLIEDPRRLAEDWSAASQLRFGDFELKFEGSRLAELELELGGAFDWDLHISEDDLLREVKPFLLARERPASHGTDRPKTWSPRRLYVRLQTPMLRLGGLGSLCTTFLRGAARKVVRRACR
ncbi:PHO85 cyclin-1 [Lecanicillium sp. MT-2017a]|nr:PHO85 cyclin-1 [Lecanicillium sp. MT-2017a]